MKPITHRPAAALRRLLGRTPATPSGRGADELGRRVEHLESALEGLQDAVYRQDVVHDRQIADLRRRHPTGPGSSGPQERRP